jgi:hypothetical protein
MTGPNPQHWKREYSGRTRVRMVVETLDEPATVTQIADTADVAWGTADSELDHLLAENRVQEHTIEGNTMYAPNPVQLLFDEILDLIDEYDRDELESTLIEHQSRLESLQSEYEVDSLSTFRERLANEELSTQEMREVRDVASTWETLETETNLVKHALGLYDDVSRLSDGTENDSSISA